MRWPHPIGACNAQRPASHGRRPPKHPQVRARESLPILFRTGREPVSSRAVNAVLSAAGLAGVLLLGLAGRYLAAIGDLSEGRLALLLATGVGALVVTIGVARRWAAVGRLLVYALYLLISTEAGLQILAAVGYLPAVNTNYNAPYGRIYWTREGFSNSIQNRFGWYAPDWELSAPRRIVLIGDSFIEGVQVGREENIAVRLDQFMRPARRADPRTTVLSLGIPGGGLAHDLEILAYATRHFAPKEVFVFVTLANDYRNALERMQHTAADRYPYYVLDASRRLVLASGSAGARERIARKLDFSHRGLLANLPRTLVSQSMLLAASRAMSLSLSAPSAPMAAEPERATGTADRHDEHWPERFPFVGGPDADEAYAVVDALLSACHDIAKSRGIELHIVTIPIFPPDFYQESGSGWSLQFGETDFLRPERDLEALGAREGIPVLPMGRWLRERGFTVEQIGGMYFFAGQMRGHWTSFGHEVFARAVYESFYQHKEASSGPAPVGAHGGVGTRLSGN